MTSMILDRNRSLDWRRVGAWSSTFATHGLIFALLALPIAAPMLHPSVPRIEPMVVDVKPLPPAVLPEPPPPIPRPRTPPVQKHVAPAPTSPPVTASPIAEAPSPITAPPAVSPVAPADTNPSTEGSTASPAGATQTLAYDGALRPTYPTASARAREQGTVLLRVLVDADGAVQRVEIERSSGHAKLDSAARDAVMRGRFRPVLRDGKAIPAWGLVPIEFRLDRG